MVDKLTSMFDGGKILACNCRATFALNKETVHRVIELDPVVSTNHTSHASSFFLPLVASNQAIPHESVPVSAILWIPFKT